MDTTARLIFALLLCCFSGNLLAYGEVSQSSQTRYWSGPSESSPAAKWGGSPTDAATAYVKGAYNGESTTTVGGCNYQVVKDYYSDACVPDGGPSFKCTTRYKYSYKKLSTSTSCTPPSGGDTADYFVYAYRKTEIGCPASSDLIGTNRCECSLGFRPNVAKDACSAYECPGPGTYTAQTTPDVKVSGVGNICSGGCSYQPNTIKSGADGVFWATWPFRATGKSCGGSATSPTDPIKSGKDTLGDAPIRCGENQCPGSVNGATVCVPCKGTSSSGPSTAASGVQPGDPAPDPNNPDSGIKSTEKKTDCNGTICKTTEYYKNGAGEIIGEKTTEESQKSFCDENPRSPMCKEGSFGGGCGAFTCDGDGVQCALSLEVHRRNCEWAEVDENLKQIGVESMTGESKPAGHPGGEVDQSSIVFSSVISQQDLIGSGCPSDVSISYAGRAWIIPWAQHCDKLQLVGNLMVAVSMLAAAVIVFRG